VRTAPFGARQADRSGSTCDSLLVIDYGAHQFSADFACHVASNSRTRVVYAFPDPVPTPNAQAVVIANDSAIEQRIRLRRPFDRYSWRRLLSEVDLAQGCFRLVVKERPTRIFSSCMPIISQVGVYLSARLVGAEFVYWLQDISSIGGLASFPNANPLLAAVVRLNGYIERALLRRSDKVIAIAPEFETWLKEIGVPPSHIFVQPNWCDVSRISPAQRAPRSVRPGTAKREFLYAGTVGLKHDVNMLVALHETLNEAGCLLTVISEGEGAQALEAASIRVLPFQAADDHARLLASADVLVVTLRKAAGAFSVPSKVNAYLCAGRPILAAIPNDNLAAQLLMSVGASVVEPDDTVGFLETARSLCSADLATLEEIGRCCRLYAEANFSIESISAGLMNGSFRTHSSGHEMASNMQEAG
jgi:colanic acid biosynthesis glycosyl transferase WcaI